MTDIADMYDEDIAELGKVMVELNQRWSRRQNTKDNLQEFAKEANDLFIKAGFIVNVQWENTLIAVPDISAPGGIKQLPITVEVVGRIGAGHGIIDQGHVLMDHERKRDEVIKANERGERFLGEKGK